ncbi:hypothetical protein [Pelagibius sp. Alg239-R121]|uniref:hypothetical protein n=1 Tax=Pelagibius sp. Alg239-R121 TaxID=2993448 RepID=UPI0024A7634A|nr:hypothetical protein [Pelagibius sp. Alg239-R121]
MAFHTQAIVGSPIAYSIYDDVRNLLNFVFTDQTGLTVLKNSVDLTDAKDVNKPSDTSEHMAYHIQLDGELVTNGAPQLINSQTSGHCHLEMAPDSGNRCGFPMLLRSAKLITNSQAKLLIQDLAR